MSQSSTRLLNATTDYNRRMLKLCADFEKLTGNEHSSRFRSFIEYHVEQSNTLPSFYNILFRHIENVSPDIFARVERGDMSVLADESVRHSEVSDDLLKNLRGCWQDVPNGAKNTLFKNIQGIFKIAQFVKDHLYEDLLRTCL
jgi:hypothetical protein